MTIFKKIFSGSKENLIDRACTIGIRFIEPVVFLYFLSIEGYGEWLILITIPYYLSISELGFGDVITNEINMLKEKKKIIYCRYLFQNLLKFIIYITIFLLIIFFLSLYNFDFFVFKTISSNQLTDILIFLAIYTLASQINGVFIKFLSINNKYNLSVKLNYLNKIFEIFFISIFLFIFNDLVYVALVILIVKTIFLFVTIFYVKKYVAWFNLNNLKNFKILISKNFFKKYFAKSILYAGMPLGQILRIQATTLIIGLTLGPEILVIVNIYLTLARLPIQIANIADGIIKIELAKLYMKKNFLLFKKYFITNIFFATFVGILYLIFMSFAGELFLNYWLNQKITYYHNIFIIFLFYGFIYTVTLSISNPLFSTNNFKFISIIFLLINIIATITLKIFSGKYGLIFVVSNLIFFEIIYLFSCFISSKKVFNLKLSEYKLDISFLKRIFKTL